MFINSEKSARNTLGVPICARNRHRIDFEDMLRSASVRLN